MIVKMSPRETKDLFSIAAEDILQRTFFYDNLADLKGTLPPIMVKYLQGQYFSYHMAKEDERVLKYNFVDLYSLIEGGTLEGGRLYTMKREYVRVSQWCDFDLLPFDKFPQQKQRIHRNYMTSYYCRTCWFDKVSAYYRTQQRDKNVKVDVREVVSEYNVTGLICDGITYVHLCAICKCRVIKITGPLPDIIDCGKYENSGDEDSEEDEEEDFLDRYWDEDEEEDSTFDSSW